MTTLKLVWIGWRENSAIEPDCRRTKMQLYVVLTLDFIAVDCFQGWHECFYSLFSLSSLIIK